MELNGWIPIIAMGAILVLFSGVRVSIITLYKIICYWPCRPGARVRMRKDVRKPLFENGTTILKGTTGIVSYLKDRNNILVDFPQSGTFYCSRDELESVKKER
ncbi:MAG: hypothetical protein ACOC32_02300 [Nanoarchaeota archaeon]